MSENETGWLYNGIFYQTRRELTDTFKWSTCIFKMKVKENEIIKITNQQAKAYEQSTNPRK